MKDRANISTAAVQGGRGDAGFVAVKAAGAVKLETGAFISSATFGPGSAGLMDLQASDLALSGGSFLSSSTNGTGHAGRIAVRLGGGLSLTDASSVQSSTSGAGSAGSVTVAAARVSIDGLDSGVGAFAAPGSSGQVGSIGVQASESIQIVNRGAVSISNAAVVADARPRVPTSISLIAPVIVLNQGIVNASSFGNVSASDISVAAALSLDASNNAAITTSANAGNGGAIRVATGGLLTLRKSVVQTSVFGLLGNGGDIDVSAGTLLLDTGFIQANTAARNASGGLVRIAANGLVASGNSLFLGGNTALIPSDLFGFNVIQLPHPPESAE